jgi:hypothetical protein
MLLLKLLQRLKKKQVQVAALFQAAAVQVAEHLVFQQVELQLSLTKSKTQTQLSRTTKIRQTHTNTNLMTLHQLNGQLRLLNTFTQRVL